MIEKTFEPYRLSHGLDHDSIALARESFGGPKPDAGAALTANGVPPTPGQCPASYDITQQGNIYHVSIDLDYISFYMPKDRALLVWLHERAVGETIYLTPINLFPPTNVCLWLCHLAPLFEALINCKATVIGMLESPMMSIDAYALMACHRIQIGPYALFSVSPAWAQLNGGIAPDEAARRAIAIKLYHRAIELQLLTEDEVAQIIDGRSITLTPDHFANASFEHLTVTKGCSDGIVTS